MQISKYLIMLLAISPVWSGTSRGDSAPQSGDAIGKEAHITHVDPASSSPSSAGQGLAVFNLDTDPRSDVVLAWLGSTASSQMVQYQVLYNMESNGYVEQSSEVRTLGIVDDRVIGTALTEGNIDAQEGVDLIFAWLQEGGRIRYRVGKNINVDGTVKWSDPLVAIHAGEKSKGLGASLYDLDRNRKEDLILVWAEQTPDGYIGRYRIGFDLNDQGEATRWSDVHKVGVGGGNPVLSHQLQGMGLVVGNFDSDYKPELVVSWNDHGKLTNTLNYRTAYNLNSQGQTQGWSANQGQHALGKDVVAIDSSAARIGGMPKLDLAHVWISSSKQDFTDRLVLVLDPQLTPYYRPTKVDLETVGDQYTGFSKAAVSIQKAAGIYSPAMLRDYVDAYVGDQKNMDDVIADIRFALDDLHPPIPPEVGRELEGYLLGYYRLRK